MPLRTILEIGHPTLRKSARPLRPDEIALPAWRDFIEDLVATMRHANGAGLAAIQVGETVRVAALEVGDNPRYPYKPRIPLTVAINPVLTPLSDQTFENWEGCLSVPGLRGPVTRHQHLAVRYLDPHGQTHEIQTHGLTAGTWQHECDHLDGILFVDRVTDPTRLTTWQNWERFYREPFLETLPEIQANTRPAPTPLGANRG
ncbi:MAG: peptide deformylase [Deltaproteobacteria bacterium]|nr:MAG: peptide deformylase [Deltaproteobacteria bacterium]